MRLEPSALSASAHPQDRSLCVAAVNQKKKFYFHLLIYWHEGLFLPHVFCADDSLGEAPKCHVPQADRNSWLHGDKNLSFQGVKPLQKPMAALWS